MTMHRPLALAAAALLSLTACVEEPASGSRPEYSDHGDHEQPLVDVTCFTQDPGCGCLAGTPPIDCTLTEVRGDLVLCEAGASYCVEGVWSRARAGNGGMVGIRNAGGQANGMGRRPRTSERMIEAVLP